MRKSLAFWQYHISEPFDGEGCIHFPFTTKSINLFFKLPQNNAKIVHLQVRQDLEVDRQGGYNDI